MKARLLLLSLLLIHLWGISSAVAKTYIFVSGDFPILSEEGEAGNHSGIAVDIIKIIAEKLDFQYEIRFYPWRRAQFLVRLGEADVLMVPYKTPERERWFDFSDISFFEDISSFFVRPGSDISWNGDYASLKGLKIGAIAGWSVGEEFERAAPDLKIDYAPNLDSCVKKLLLGRIDILPSQIREMKKALEVMRISQTDQPVPIKPDLSLNYNYFAFSKKQDLSEFRSRFDFELKKLKDSGWIDRILNIKYGLKTTNK